MSIRDDLKAYVDGELTPSREAEVRQALESDPTLQAEVIELRQLSAVIREASFQPEAVGLESTLLALAAARRKKAAPWFVSRRLAWGLGLAATLVLAVLTVPNLMTRGDGDTGMFGSDADVAATPAAAKATGGTESATAPALKNESVSRAGRDYPPPIDAKSLAGGAKEMTARGRAGESKERTASHGAGGVYSFEKRKAGAGVAAIPEAQSTDRPALPSYRHKVADNDLQRQPSLEVRTAEVSLQVPDVVRAQAVAADLAKDLGGRVESSGAASYDAGTATADVVLRVPVGKFSVAMARVRSLGRVVSESMTGEDVTAQVADTEARLRVLRAEEEQDIALLKKAKDVEQTLLIKDRLTELRQGIEGLDAQRKVLRDQAAMSTITAHLSQMQIPAPPRPPENWLQIVWGRAWGGLAGIGRSLASVGVYLFVFAPIWVPVVGVGWWLYRRNRRVG